MREYPELPLEPAEPVELGKCAWCGQEIYSGNRRYIGDEGMFHPGCMMEFLEEKLREPYVASMCGYQEVSA